MVDSETFERPWVHMYHRTENLSVFEQGFSLAGADAWRELAPEDFSYNTSKMISDQSLITPDSHLDHKTFMQTQGIEEAVLDSHHFNQLFFHDTVTNELILDQNVETSNDAAEIIIIPSGLVKQEDIIEGEEVVVGSHVGINVENIESQVTHHFEIGSYMDIGQNSMDEIPLKKEAIMIIDNQHSPEARLQTENYDCQECGLSFRKGTLLERHIKKFHSKQRKLTIKDKYISSKLSSSPKKRYICPSCNYSSRRRDKLDKHMKKHVLLDGMHPCGRKRHKPEELPQRQRHNAEEYHCSYCPYVCTVYTAIKKHQKMHTSGKEPCTVKLSCKVCGKDRPTESDMTRHLKKHRKGERFLCDLCEFTSTQMKKIIQHRRMHTGEKPHLCPHCSYRSARRDNLRSHVRRMHKKQNMYIDTFNPNDEKNFSAF